MADDWAEDIATSLEVGTPGGERLDIGSDLPPELELAYFTTSTTLIPFGILIYPGDGSYHYEVVGVQNGSPDVDIWASGWTDISGIVHEHYRQVGFNTGSSRIFDAWGALMSVTDTATWQFGVGYGAAKVGANIMEIFDCTVIIGGPTGDIGSVIVNVPISALDGLGVSNGLAVNTGLLSTVGNASIGGGLVVNGLLDAPGGFTDITAGSFAITPTAGVSSSVAVTFTTPLPTGKTYFVVTTANTSVTCETGTSGITRFGFTGWLTRAASVLTNVDYIAMAI